LVLATMCILKWNKWSEASSEMIPRPSHSRIKIQTIQKTQPPSDRSRRNVHIEVGQKHPSKLIRIPRSSAEVFISSRRENSAPRQGSPGLSSSKYPSSVEDGQGFTGNEICMAGAQLWALS
jgi:hypothetical protein